MTPVGVGRAVFWEAASFDGNDFPTTSNAQWPRSFLAPNPDTPQGMLAQNESRALDQWVYGGRAEHSWQVFYTEIRPDGMGPMDKVRTTYVPGVWIFTNMALRGTQVAMDLVRAAALVSIPLVAWLGVLRLWQLVVVALIVGLAGVVFDVVGAGARPVARVDGPAERAQPLGGALREHRA